MGGDNVVSVGELELRRKHRFERESAKDCLHRRLQLDDHGDVVRCDDCGAQVSAFWALEMIARHLEGAQKRIKEAAEQVKWESAKHVHMIAARKIEQAWRGRMAPCCPHCGTAILPEDGLGSVYVNRAVEMERRKQVEEEYPTSTAPATIP